MLLVFGGMMANNVPIQKEDKVAVKPQKYLSFCRHSFLALSQIKLIKV